jgi:hypothetical protein
MQGIKSPEGRWSVSLRGCSEETAHFQYGHVIVHIPRDDLRDLGLARQNVTEDAARSQSHNRFEFKKGLVQ